MISIFFFGISVCVCVRSVAIFIENFHVFFCVWRTMATSILFDGKRATTRTGKWSMIFHFFINISFPSDFVFRYFCSHILCWFVVCAIVDIWRSHFSRLLHRKSIDFYVSQFFFLSFPSLPKYTNWLVIVSHSWHQTRSFFRLPRFCSSVQRVDYSRFFLRVDETRFWISICADRQKKRQREKTTTLTCVMTRLMSPFRYTFSLKMANIAHEFHSSFTLLATNFRKIVLNCNAASS